MTGGNASPGAVIGAANRAQVLACLQTYPGITNGEIADRLGLSAMAVGRHVQTIRQSWPAAIASPPAGEDLRERVALERVREWIRGLPIPTEGATTMLGVVNDALTQAKRLGEDSAEPRPTTAPELEVDLFLAVTEDANLPADVNVADLDLKAVAERLVGLGWGRP